MMNPDHYSVYVWKSRKHGNCPLLENMPLENRCYTPHKRSHSVGSPKLDSAINFNFIN
jgi:hypothetical protein